jgi:hypothetical protein
MLRIFSLLALVSACSNESAREPAPAAEETQLEPGFQAGGELAEGDAPVHMMEGPVVVAIDYGIAGRPRSELRLDYAGPPPFLVGLLRDAMGLAPELQRAADGRLELTSLDGAVAEDGLTWLVMQERTHRYTRLHDLASVPVAPGDRLHFQLDFDDDSDGVGSRLEALYGTDDTQDDSDGDGLRDWEEIYDGWSLVDGRFVQSDPSRADADGDGMDDATERRMSTDPRTAD